MTLCVESEIGRLRRVLIHRPRREIDRMVPSHMQEHLFDDILDGEVARAEHEVFRRLFVQAGVEALDAYDLLTEVVAGEAAREELFAELAGRYALDDGLLGRMREMAPGELAAALVGGLRPPPAEGGDELAYDLSPTPNYLFQRDPQAVFGDRVLFSSMATQVRRREALLAQLLFGHHPKLSGARGTLNIDARPADGRVTTRVTPLPTLEGGDVLVASREILLVGLSQRSNRRGIERLADYLRGEESTFRYLLVVDIPPVRSYMHLDTVFTLIDHRTCLAFEPVIAGADVATVFEIDLKAKELAYVRRPSLLSALRGLGMELELVPCGGSGDRIYQEREQWTDGANAFAIAPGLVLLYRRNRRTAEELDRRGWRVVEEEEALKEGFDLLSGGPTVVTMLGNELSRARGGPRCMTMPLERDAL